MTKKKIAVLGGGIAGLTTAFELTQTPELRALHDVTVYQLGFRLGGKLASGRREPAFDNVEHGLHVWFGFYENVFMLLKKAYAEWEKDPRGPFQTWQGVIEPRSYTPIGYHIGERWGLYPQLWFENSDEPGDGRVELSLMGVVTGLLSALDRLLLHGIDDPDDADPESDVPDWVHEVFHDAVSLIERAGVELSELSWMRATAQRMRSMVEALNDDALAFVGRYPQPFLWMLERFSRRIHAAVEKHADGPAFTLLNWLLADYVVTMLRGLLNPRYKLLEGADLDTLNDIEFTDFMRDNGASERLLQSTFIRVIYETAFQYVDGDVAKPNVEAGTCLRIVFRMLFTYKGAMLWEVRGGMGDVLIAPLYQVLNSMCILNWSS